MDALQIDGWELDGGQVVPYEGLAATWRFNVARSPGPRPSCCGKPMRSRGIQPLEIIDAPAFNLPVRWNLKARRYRCLQCGASEALPGIGKEHCTARAEEFISRQAALRPFVDVASDLGTTPDRVGKVAKRIWRARPTYDFPPVRYLGIDEIELEDKGDPFDTSRRKRVVFVDLESGQLLDMLMEHNEKAVVKWLVNLPHGERVRAVAMDFDRTYRNAVIKALPHSKIVIDHFHIMQELNSLADKVRTTSIAAKPIRSTRRLPNIDPELDWSEEPWGALRGTVHPSRDDMRQITQTLRSGKRPRPGSPADFALQGFLADYPRIKTAYEAKMRLRAVWGADYACQDDARLAFRIWDKSLEEEIRPKFQRFIDNIYRNTDDVFRFFELPISNGRAEHANREIRRLIANSMDSMHLETVRLKARAQARIKAKRKFHCDSCLKHVSDHPQKVSEVMLTHPEQFLVHREGDEIWLCQACKKRVKDFDLSSPDVIVVPRPTEKPFLAYRHLRQMPKGDIDSGYSIDYWEAIDESIAQLPA